MKDHSHKPKSHPKRHTQAELKLIHDMPKRNPHAGPVIFRVKLCLRGYAGTITGLYRAFRKHGELPVKIKNPKYIPKPYEAMTYSGQRVQIDIQHVPKACIISNSIASQYCQYTAIDEYSRFRSVEGSDELDTLFLRLS